jgi:hypothetical protein
MLRWRLLLLFATRGSERDDAALLPAGWKEMAATTLPCSHSSHALSRSLTLALSFGELASSN